MYCFQFILVYNLCSVAAGALKNGILYDKGNENGLDSSIFKESINVLNYVEKNEKRNEGIFSIQESMIKTLEELIKRMGMLEEKVRAYDKNCMHKKLMEEKMLAAEEVAIKHSYRIKILEKMLHKSEHTRRVQYMVLQRRLKDADRRLLHVEAFGNKLRIPLEHLYHKRMINKVNLNDDHRIHATHGSFDVGNHSSNYKEIRNNGDPLSRAKLSSDDILKAIHDVPRLRIGFSAVQDQHGESVHDGQTIIFHNVNFNEAGAFDTSTGMFRCPVSGAYFVTFTVCSYNGHRIHASLVIDGNLMFEVFGGVGNDDVSIHDSTGTGSAIIQCQAGGLIWAKVLKGDTIVSNTYLVQTRNGTKTSPFFCIYRHPAIRYNKMTEHLFRGVSIPSEFGNSISGNLIMSGDFNSDFACPENPYTSKFLAFIPRSSSSNWCLKKLPLDSALYPFSTYLS